MWKKELPSTKKNTNRYFIAIIYLYIDLSIYLSIYLSICLSTHIAIQLKISVEKTAVDSTTQSNSDATISYSDSDGEPYFFTDSESEENDNQVNHVSF